MDMLLVRRRLLTSPPAPFKCACGRLVAGWDTPLDRIARCPACKRQEYHLLKAGPTESGDAYEWVIAARGVILDDEAAFAGQGFHVQKPQGGMFFPDLPMITGELTRLDGSLKDMTDPNA